MKYQDESTNVSMVSVSRRAGPSHFGHRVFTNSARVKALSVNISQGGMCLFAVANLNLGSSVEVEFKFPNSSGIKRVPGRILHRALYLYGIEFLREKEFSPDTALSSANAEITAKPS